EVLKRMVSPEIDEVLFNLNGLDTAIGYEGAKPLPPDRKLHDLHVKKLETYMKEVELLPRTLLVLRFGADLWALICWPTCGVPGAADFSTPVSVPKGSKVAERKAALLKELAELEKEEADSLHETEKKEEADSLDETQKKEEADSLHETEKKDLPLNLVKVEVDLESEASTAGTPRGQLVQRQDSLSSLSPIGRQDSLDSLDSRDSKTGLKRKASFETPSPKKRVFEEGSNPVQVRQLEQLKKTIEKDSPAYYWLDYLWGKTPEREAQPGLKPDTASERQRKQQEQKMQSLQARASQAVVELGLQPVVKVVRQKKAGRPPGSQNKVKPVPTLRKRRADVAAKAKLGMMAELDRLAIEKASKREARLQLMKQYGVSETFCWNKRQKVSNFVARAATGSTGARQPGSHLALVHMVSQPAGKRVPEEGKALGRPDHLKSVWQETRAWALSEEARQHILTAGDVLLHFEDRLEAAIAVRQAEETAGMLDKTGQVELAAMRQKRDSLTNNQRQKDKYQVKLSPEEEKARLETAWRRPGSSQAQER
ncbi:unnamed protein product, partial [Symbiodinium sp. KB8]